MFWLSMYLAWNYIQIIRGFFVAESYWDWKGLITNAMSLSLPVVALACSQDKLAQIILHIYFKYSLWFLAVVIVVSDPGAIGFYLAPVSFLLIFFVLLTKKWKILLLGLTALVLMIDLDARSNVIKFSVPLLLVGFASLLDFHRVFLVEWVRKGLFLVPTLFFFLGISGVFNVFKLDEYIDGEYRQIKKDEKGELVSVNLKADTRTGLYTEVLQTASKYNSWVFGRSPARGNETELFAQLAEITGKKERLGNEAALLNVFTWTGIIGVLLYMMVFYQATFLAVNRSNNVYSKLLGLYIGFRWVYAWVEDINNFSLNYFVLWIFIGLCFSQSFRELTNQEVKWWVRGIFDKKYRYHIKHSKVNVFV